MAAHLDPMLDRKKGTLALNSFWLENEDSGRDAGFADALARGLIRLAGFAKAVHLDLSVVKPTILRRHLQSRMRAHGL